MVDVEKIFDAEFKDLQGLELFSYGGQEHLDEIILARKSNVYPLLYYLLPNEEGVKDDISKGRFTFVLAHNTKLDWFNDQRFEKVFRTVLYPLLELMLEKMQVSKSITMLDIDNDSRYYLKKYPNYAHYLTKDGSTETKAQQVDYWDAMLITFKLEIRDNCKL